MSPSEQIGLNLRRVRRHAGMSQEDLSRRTGLHRNKISLPERSGRVPLLDTVVRLAVGTGAETGELVEGVLWHEPPRWDERGWFTIVGLLEPAEVRVPRPWRAGDLDRLEESSDPGRMIGEGAALGRLAFWLEHGEVLLPDRAAREVVARIARETEESDRDLLERCADVVAGHDALRAFLVHLGGPAPEARAGSDG